MVDLGINTDNRPNQKTNTEAVKKKEMNRRYFFCVQQNNGDFLSLICGKHSELWWGSSIGAGDTNRMNKLIRKAGSVTGCKLHTFEVVVERSSLNKLLSIMYNPDHLSAPLRQAAEELLK